MRAPEDIARSREEDRQRQAKRDVSTRGYRVFPAYWRTTGTWNTLLACLGAAIIVAIVAINILY